MKRWIKKGAWGLIIVGTIAGVSGWCLKQDKEDMVSFKTAEVIRGDLLVSISATGTVEPEEVVDVGAQVAGQIVSFGKDVNGKTVDYGSVVDEGTVLARIDDSLYVSQVDQSEAQVQSARANLKAAEANLAQMKARLNQAQRDWDRAKKLGPSEALAQSSYDAYQAAFETAEANVSSAEADILKNKANVSQMQAALEHAQQNLGYCTIKSPVKGVIIDRRVNIGQTVVASLNAPSLFLIAKDLKRMQVWVAVNEADIGKIYPGQPVTFTVDAFPGESFMGEVGKVRLNASMTQNVVTYTVEILTDNSTGRLLPYLTANVQFEVSHTNNALQAPNAALRWKPTLEQVEPSRRKEFENVLASKDNPQKSNQPMAKGVPKTQGKNDSRGLVWMPAEHYVQPVRVQPGISDGTMTVVEGEGIKEGMKVITGVESKDIGQADASNPFAPQFMRGGRSGQQR
jgi:HlyD family secretion protein